MSGGTPGLLARLAESPQEGSDSASRSAMAANRHGRWIRD